MPLAIYADATKVSARPVTPCACQPAPRAPAQAPATYHLVHVHTPLALPGPQYKNTHALFAPPTHAHSPGHQRVPAVWHAAPTALWCPCRGGGATQLLFIQVRPGAPCVAQQAPLSAPLHSPLPRHARLLVNPPCTPLRPQQAMHAFATPCRRWAAEERRTAMRMHFSTIAKLRRTGPFQLPPAPGSGSSSGSGSGPASKAQASSGTGAAGEGPTKQEAGKARPAPVVRCYGLLHRAVAARAHAVVRWLLLGDGKAPWSPAEALSMHVAALPARSLTAKNLRALCSQLLRPWAAATAGGDPAAAGPGQGQGQAQQGQQGQEQQEEMSAELVVSTLMSSLVSNVGLGTLEGVTPFHLAVLMVGGWGHVCGACGYELMLEAHAPGTMPRSLHTARGCSCFLISAQRRLICWSPLPLP